PDPIWTPALSAQITTDTGGNFNVPAIEERFQRVGLRPGQHTTIVLSFPSSMADQAVNVSALDGGTVTLGAQGRVLPNGTFIIHYEAANAVGHYRLFVGQGDF